MVLLAPAFAWAASQVGYAEPLENAAETTGATDAAETLNPGLMPDYGVPGLRGRTRHARLGARRHRTDSRSRDGDGPGAGGLRWSSTPSTAPSRPSATGRRRSCCRRPSPNATASSRRSTPSRSSWASSRSSSSPSPPTTSAPTALLGLAVALALASRVPMSTFAERLALPTIPSLVVVAPQAVLMDGPVVVATLPLPVVPLTVTEPGVAYVVMFAVRVAACVGFLSLLLLTTRFSGVLAALRRLRAASTRRHAHRRHPPVPAAFLPRVDQNDARPPEPPVRAGVAAVVLAALGVVPRDVLSADVRAGRAGPARRRRRPRDADDAIRPAPTRSASPTPPSSPWWP